MTNLALALQQAMRYHEALELLDRHLRLCREHLGERHPIVGHTMSIRAGVLSRLGQIEEGFDAMLEVVDFNREVYGPHHFETVSQLSSTLLAGVGVLEQSRLHRVAEELEAAMETLPDTSRPLLSATHVLGKYLRYERRPAEAIDLVAPALEIALERHGIEWHVTRDLAHCYAETLELQGEFEEALPLYEVSLEIQDPTMHHLDQALLHYGRCLRKAGHLDEAEEVLLEAQTIANGKAPHEYTQKMLQLNLDRIHEAREGGNE